MKKVINFFSKIIDFIDDIIYYLCYILSNGFFFYFYLISLILYKIIHIEFFKKAKEFFKKRQKDTISFLAVVFIFLVGVLLYTQFYPETRVIHINGRNTNQKINKNETNLYKRYSQYGVKDINFKELKKVNKDVVAWIMVDGTSINYPIVKTTDNDYYLTHDIKKRVKSSGWTFMDYRNDEDLSNDNTIFYGHNLVNKTAFGSLSNLFEAKWYNNSNHSILVITEKGKYLYEVFSIYTIEPELYYLQTDFKKEKDSNTFYNELKKRSVYKFKTEVNGKDKIITLSTCTDDNKQRRVVHAKLIKK